MRNFEVGRTWRTPTVVRDLKELEQSPRVCSWNLQWVYYLLLMLHETRVLQAGTQKHVWGWSNRMDRLSTRLKILVLDKLSIPVVGRLQRGITTTKSVIEDELISSTWKISFISRGSGISLSQNTEYIKIPTDQELNNSPWRFRLIVSRRSAISLRKTEWSKATKVSILLIFCAARL